MAVYNEIQIGRINRFLQKYLAIKGGPPAPQLAADITTALNLWNGVENRYLEGWNRFAGSFGTVAQAANTSAIKLRNPATSNVIIVIEQLAAQSNIADANLGVTHGPTATDYNTVPALTLTRLDPRGNPQPSAIVSQTSGAQNGAGFGATIDNIGAAAAVINQRIPIIFEDFQAIPVLPGDGIQVGGGVNNEVLTVTYVWRERFLEDSERT
jgi:hypothetical protein